MLKLQTAGRLRLYAKTIKVKTESYVNNRFSSNKPIKGIIKETSIDILPKPKLIK